MPGMKKRPGAPEQARPDKKQSKQPAKQAAAESSPQRDSPVSIVGIGAPAGGLEAFQEFLQALPEDTGMAFVLVQHLVPKHESILSELCRKSQNCRSSK
jgi:two-component system CheB/CheR fusion protein